MSDAFLYKLGYRAVEWTKEETAQWKQKKQATRLTRDQTDYHEIQEPPNVIRFHRV